MDLSVFLNGLKRLFCRIFRKHFRFAKFTRVAMHCNRFRLSEKVGVDYYSLLKEINRSIHAVEAPPKALKSKFVDLGGSNNLGMITQYSKITSVPFYTTKLEPTYLAERELAFLEWQGNYLDQKKYVAPRLICNQRIFESEYSALTMEYLYTPNVYETDAILSLYKKLGELTSNLCQIKGAACDSGKPNFPLKAETKITRIIKYVVTQLHEPSAYIYIEKYLHNRKNVLDVKPGSYKELLSFVKNSKKLVENFDYDRNYGLFHGDFKQTNIMSNHAGELRVIDLQYYNYGARLWDMAFYCSKEDASFGELFNLYIRPLKVSTEEAHIFVLLFVIASLLHVRKSTVKKILHMKVLPAIQSLDGE